MRTIRDIDFLGDEELRGRLYRWSLAILGLGLLGGVALCLSGGAYPPAEAAHLAVAGGLGWLLWLVALAVVSFVALPVHELVHALYFRLFGGPGTKVTFGCQAGMLYAGCPGLVLERDRFCIVLAAPAIILSAALLGVGSLLDLPFLGYVVFVLHLSGCAGDLLAIWEIRRERSCIRCEDTEHGVRLLGV